MRLQTIEQLRTHDATSIETDDNETKTVGNRPRRTLRGREKRVSNLEEICEVLSLDFSIVQRALIRYSKQTYPGSDVKLLPEGDFELRLLPTELFTQLEIPVLEFQETEVYSTHRA